MTLKRFDTAHLAPKERFDYWNSVICQSFTQMSCRPKLRAQDSLENYKSHLESWDLGDIQVLRVRNTAADVDHNQNHIVSATEGVDLVHLQLGGYSLNIQNGQEALLRQGDFTIVNSTKPYSLHFDQDVDMIVIRLPHAVTKRYFQQDERVYGRKFAAGGGIGTSSLFSDFTRRLWNHAAENLSAKQCSSLSESTLSLLTCHLASLEGSRVQDEKDRNGKLKVLQLYIADHLENERLCASSIAQANHMSERTLRNLFSETGETCSAYIYRQRLNYAKRLLAEPEYINKKMIEIAMLCGFSNASHFSSRFKSAFGLSPKEYRDSQFGG